MVDPIYASIIWEKDVFCVNIGKYCHYTMDSNNSAKYINRVKSYNLVF